MINFLLKFTHKPISPTTYRPWMSITTFSCHCLSTIDTHTPFSGTTVAVSFNLRGFSDLSHVFILYFCNTLASASFASSSAKRRPTQFLGPTPKGIHARGWRFLFLSPVNLLKLYNNNNVVQKDTIS